MMAREAREDVIFGPLAPADAGDLAALHAATGEEPWSERSWAVLLETGPGPALAARAAGRLVGAVLCRCAADEAELLVIAVDAGWRRRGIARALLAAAIRDSAARGARNLFLEVADDNAPAISLYLGAGFIDAGRRIGYYRRRGTRVDARLLARPLALDPARRDF